MARSIRRIVFEECVRIVRFSIEAPQRPFYPQFKEERASAQIRERLPIRLRQPQLIRRATLCRILAAHSRKRWREKHSLGNHEALFSKRSLAVYIVQPPDAAGLFRHRQRELVL